MRLDDECRRAFLERNVASLREMPPRELVHYARLRDTSLIVKLPVTYLGIVRNAPQADLQDEPVVGLKARLWSPGSAEDVAVTRAVVNVGIEMLADERGAPGLLLLPGEHAPVCHPHVVPTLPGSICLLDDYRADVTTLADICRSLIAMLRFEAGRWSLDRSRALAPKVADWLAGPGAGLFDFPLAGCEGGGSEGIRVLGAYPETPPQTGDRQPFCANGAQNGVSPNGPPPSQDRLLAGEEERGRHEQARGGP